jgi:hypothetical protein
MHASCAVHAASELEGSLIYADKDHSFRFDAGSPASFMERAGNEGLMSLTIGTLQVEVGVATRLVLFVWGLHPRQRWVEGSVPQPNARPGVVEVLSPRDLQRGVSVSLADAGEWLTTYDSATDWLHVAPRGSSQGEETILVSTGIALGVQRQRGWLSSIWLRPVLD